MIDMVDLGLISQGPRRRGGLAQQVPGGEAIRDPNAFFSITYPTEEIVSTLQTLARRVADPHGVPGTILLSGRYGQGKSHVLLAAYHALTTPAEARAWAERWNLGELALPENPIVIARSFIQHAEESLWDMLSKSLAKGRKAPAGDYPDGEFIESLLGDQHVFLIMDELERWYDAQEEKKQSRNRNFLQALTEVSMRNPRLTVLGSVLGEKEEPAGTIRRVRPLELSFRSADDRRRVVLFRLFEDRHLESAKKAAEDITDAYLECYRNASLPGLDGWRARAIDCWPFTPEFIDILTMKIPNLGGFQSIRGNLRFLAHVVRNTHSRRPLVSSQDLPFHDSTVALGLHNLDISGGEVVRRALGDNYEAVPRDLPHKDELFSTLVFYSIADPTHPGATMEEILFATLDPNENPIRIRDSVSRLKQHAFNLHEQEHRFVFQAVENPHARINAMAGSQGVTRSAARQHILEALKLTWGSSDITAVLDDDDWPATKKRLREIHPRRPRILLSTRTMSSVERLKAQNLDDDRNLVLLVEPKMRTATGAGSYSMLGDEILVRAAKRIEACNLLLEGKPDGKVALVYRTVREQETKALREGIQERYGVTIQWHQAGPDGSNVDESWYELHTLDTCSGQALLALWHQELTGQPDVAAELQNRWSDYRQRTVAELVTSFERNPGWPVPLDASWVPQAIRQHLRQGLFSVVGVDGGRVERARVETLSDDDLRQCTLVDPATETGPEHSSGPTVIIHPHVSAQYDPTKGGVVLTWTLPPQSPGSGPFATLIQRYTESRSWEVRSFVPVDPGETHEANRYHGTDESFVDTQRLRGGEWYHYYVFLRQDRPDGTPLFALSQRCDVEVPRRQVSQRPGVLDTGIQTNANKLMGEGEKLLMSGKHMSSNDRIATIEIKISSVRDRTLWAPIVPKLAEKGGASMEGAADLNVVIKGSYTRHEAFDMLRALPRIEGATYAAMFTLEKAPATKDQGNGQAG